MALLALAFFVIAIPPGHSQILPSNPSSALGSPQESLVFTVNPDKSVDVGMTTSTSLPVSGVSGLLTSGYKLHSSSNFTQLTNAVVENTTVQYQLPPGLSSVVSSITLTASQTGLAGSGSLSIATTLPVKSLSIVYSTAPSQIQVNATAQLQLNCTLCAAFGPLANQTAFQQLWLKTFANASWTNMIKNQIYTNSTGALTVTTFSGTEVDSTTSANVTIRFAAVPTGPSADFVTALENALFKTGIPSGLDAIIRSAIALSTGESASLSYNQQTGLLIIKASTTFVGNLDAQLNNLKKQFFQLYLPLLPASMITPAELFLNSTTVTVSKIQTTSDLDLNAGTSKSTFSGLILNPPTEGPSSNFTIHGLFQTLGSAPLTPSGVNITLAGGSDNTYQVKIVVPNDGTPAPSSTTSNSATWLNVQNASKLQNVEFQLQRLPTSIFAFFTTPFGIAVDAIIAAAIIGSVLLLLRRRRMRMPTGLPPSGPTTTPGMGPSPTPTTP